MSDSFEITVRVAPADIDEQGHVNNLVYLRWAQEVATAHWRAIAPADALANTGWVVLRHEIDYKAPALLHDEVLVRTWVGAAPGLAFERYTESIRASNAELLAYARTLWCPVNPATSRPKRVSPELRAMFSAPAG